MSSRPTKIRAETPTAGTRIMGTRQRHRMTESIAPASSSVVAPGGTKSSSSTGSASDRQEPAYRVLVVEDDASQALFAEGVLRGAGIEARGARTAADVLPEMERFHPDLVLMDLHMPVIPGMW